MYSLHACTASLDLQSVVQICLFYDKPHWYCNEHPSNYRTLHILDNECKHHCTQQLFLQMLLELFRHTTDSFISIKALAAATKETRNQYKPAMIHIHTTHTHTSPMHLSNTHILFTNDCMCFFVFFFFVNTRCWVPIMLSYEPPSLLAVDIPGVNFQQAHFGRQSFCQVFRGLPTGAVSSTTASSFLSTRSVPSLFFRSSTLALPSLPMSYTTSSHTCVPSHANPALHTSFML